MPHSSAPARHNCPSRPPARSFSRRYTRICTLPLFVCAPLIIGIIRNLQEYLKANKHILFRHVLNPMRLIYAVFIFFLALMISAQCQQTEEKWCSKGSDFVCQGEYAEAIKAFDNALRLDPNYVDAWFGKKKKNAHQAGIT